MITKNLVVKIQNLDVNQESQAIKSNPAQNNGTVYWREKEKGVFVREHLANLTNMVTTI